MWVVAIRLTVYLVFNSSGLSDDDFKAAIAIGMNCLHLGAGQTAMIDVVKIDRVFLLDFNAYCACDTLLYGIMRDCNTR